MTAIVLFVDNNTILLFASLLKLIKLDAAAVSDRNCSFKHMSVKQFFAVCMTHYLQPVALFFA